MTPEEHFAAFLKGIGVGEDQELAKTPARVTTLFRKLTKSHNEPTPTLSSFRADESENESGEVIVRDIAFKSLCIHHFVPFFGHVDIAYLPKDTLAGFGGFCRLVEHFASRPQLQERMANDIADAVWEQLDPVGVAVRCRARQFCVELNNPGQTPTFTVVEKRGVVGDWFPEEE